MQNDWSEKRKRIIFWGVILIFIFLVAIPLFSIYYKAPTCFDSKRNGDETGIDCGGSCQLICSPESLPLLSRGDPRVLTVTPGVFEVVAVFDNPNAFGEVYHARYSIKIFDTGSTPVKIISGDTYIPRGSTFAIFEGPFNLSVVPLRATFEWDPASLVWKKFNVPIPHIDILNKTLSKEDSTPRVDAVVRNSTLDTIPNIELVSLVLNGPGNIIAASKTYIDVLDKGESLPVVFAWPAPFKDKAAGIEIYPRFFPDRSFLK